MRNCGDADEMCLHRENATGERMFREYQKLDKRTMESKHDRFDDLPTDQLVNDRDVNETCIAKGCPTQESVSREYKN